MTSQLHLRQPFGVLDDSRLQALTSIKNRQNNILSPRPFKSVHSLKAPASAPAKKRLASDLLADDFDSENIDPSLALSPSKRSKTAIDTPLKKALFQLRDAPLTAPSKFKIAQPAPLELSLSSASTALDLRGSLPQNRRVSLLSTGRRLKTPFRRVGPLNKPSPLPFSIDAALSGTISSYTPSAPSVAEPAAAALSKKSSKSMPNTWFFDIHEDTPDQEATNLMEHSASVLDISSDDDTISSRAKDAQERGKENIPPPEWVAPLRSVRGASRGVHKGIKCPKKAAKYAISKGPDAMAEDRSALGDLDATVFWVEDDNAVDANADNQSMAQGEPAEEPEPSTEETPAAQPEPISTSEPFTIRQDTPEADLPTTL